MKLHEVFLYIERKYNLNALKIDDYRFWVYNRFTIYSEYEKIVNGYEDSGDSLPSRKVLLRYIKGIYNITKSHIRRRTIRFRKKNEDVYIVKSHPRRILLNGTYKSIYTDLIFENSPHVVTYEETDFYTHKQPCYTKNIIYLDELELRSGIMYYLNKYLLKYRYRKRYVNIQSQLQNAIHELNELSGVHINYDALTDKIIKRYYLAKYSEAYWVKELKSYNVKAVITVVGYNLHSLALTKEAHKVGLPVIEMQHGTIIESHIAYQYDDNLACDMLPDYICTFSDFWTPEINIKGGGSKLCPIGFEYFNIQKEKFDKLNNNRNNIIILSAKNVSEKLRSIAKQISSLISKHDLSYHIIYKLHPSEFPNAETSYKELYEDRNIDIIKDEVDLYDLFSKSIIQIGNNSTALFEGMGFGLKTFFLRSNDSLIDRMVKDNYAQYVDETSDLYKLLFDSEACDVVSIAGFMWPKDAKSNFFKELGQIIHQGN